jgi:hypothetical protein
MFKDKDRTIQRMWNVKPRMAPTGNGRDNWNNLKIFHKIPEQHICEVRYEGNTENFLKFPCKSRKVLS